MLAGVGPKEPKLRRGTSPHGPVEPPGGEVDLPASNSNIICTYKALQRRTIPCDICNPLSFRFLDGIRSKKQRFFLEYSSAMP
jgi:hypothetical protein